MLRSRNTTQQWEFEILWKHIVYVAVKKEKLGESGDTFMGRKNIQFWSVSGAGRRQQGGRKNITQHFTLTKEAGGLRLIRTLMRIKGL